MIILSKYIISFPCITVKERKYKLLFFSRLSQIELMAYFNREFYFNNANTTTSAQVGVSHTVDVSVLT